MGPAPAIEFIGAGRFDRGEILSEPLTTSREPEVIVRSMPPPTNRALPSNTVMRAG